MNILFLCNDDAGGNSYYTMQAINRHTEHQARAVKFMQSWLQYPADIFRPDQTTLDRLYRWADVVHIRNRWDSIPAGFEKKPVVVTFTNVWFRNHPDAAMLTCIDRGWIVTVSTVDLLAAWEDVLWMPNPREDGLGLGRKRHDTFTVCHSPTKRERKGTDTIIRAMKGLKGVDLDVIEFTPYAECERRKARCHLTIDQFDLGYGNSAIEAWALSQPVISYAQNASWVPGFVRAENGDQLPWREVPENVRRLREAVMAFKEERELYQEFVDVGRAWYLKHHTPKAVAANAVGIFERVLDA